MKNELFTKGKEKSKKRDSKRTAPEQPPAVKTPYKPHGQAADLINFLQQTRGNQQVQQMIESGELHAMLRVSQANDPLEREADRVADMVVDSFSPEFDVDEYINNTFAASNAMRGKTVDDLFPNRVKGLGGGKALPQTERTFFEERFGADFSGVRVYTGPTADEFARAINARAFTYRQDIVFADGEYAPGTREGRRLMAHELTHVLQDKQDVVQRQDNDNYYYKYYTQQSRDLVNEQNRINQYKSLGEFVVSIDNLHLVANPNTFKTSRLAYLPKGTKVQLIDRGEKQPFNKTIDQNKWWKVKVLESDYEHRHLAGKIGWCMKTGLGSVPRWTSQPEGIREASNVKITANPDKHPLLKGNTVTYFITHDPMFITKGSVVFPVMGPWKVTDPDGKVIEKENKQTVTVTMNKIGRWKIEVPVKRSGEKQYTLKYEHDVITAEALAEIELPNINTYDFMSFRASLEMSKLTRERFNEQAITTPKTSFPHLTCPEPTTVTAADDPRKMFHYYTVQSKNNSARYKWTVLTNAWNGDVAKYTQSQWGDATFADVKNRAPSMEFHRIGDSKSNNGLNAYTQYGYQNTSSKTFGIYVSSSGKYIIMCEELSSDGKPTGRIAKYAQIVLNKGNGKQYEALSRHIKNIDKEIEHIKDGQETPIQAIYVNKETNQCMGLSLYCGPDAKTKGKIHLLDLTPGVGRIGYEGNTIQEAVNAFDKGNAYPEGVIRFTIPRTSFNKSDLTYKLNTDGKSSWQQWAANAGWASLGLAGLGIIAAFVPFPGARIVAGICFVSSGVTGATSAGLSLYDRLQQAEIDKTGVAIDVLALASSILGSASAFRALRHGSKLAVASRTSKFLLWSGFATDAASGVLITIDGVEQISDILDSKMSRGEKTGAIIRVLANLALHSGLMMLAVRDLKAGGKGKKSKTVSKTKASKGLEDIPHRVPKDDYYAPIREITDGSDIKKIAEITGFSESKIKQAKDHLMKNEHILIDDVTGEVYKGRFTPYKEIADDWQQILSGEKLSDGTIDRIKKLIHHEYGESLIMNGQQEFLYKAFKQNKLENMLKDFLKNEAKLDENIINNILQIEPKPITPYRYAHIRAHYSGFPN